MHFKHFYASSIPSQGICPLQGMATKSQTLLQQISESANKLLKTLQQEKNFQTDSDLDLDTDMDMDWQSEMETEMEMELQRKRRRGRES